MPEVDAQKKFFRTLWITLISVLGPFIIVGTINAISDHHRIQTNEKHITALEQTRVSNQIMLLYVDELRNMHTLLRQDVNEKDGEINVKINEINARLDKLIEDLYEVRKRGLGPGEALIYPDGSVVQNGLP